MAQVASLLAATWMDLAVRLREALGGAANVQRDDAEHDGEGVRVDDRLVKQKFVASPYCAAWLCAARKRAYSNHAAPSRMASRTLRRPSTPVAISARPAATSAQRVHCHFFSGNAVAMDTILVDTRG